MPVIHISEAEAARDLHRVLEQVRAGAEVLIENGSGAVRLTQAGTSAGDLPQQAIEFHSMDERIAYIRKHGSGARLDGGLSKYLEEVIEEGQKERFVDWESS